MPRDPRPPAYIVTPGQRRRSRVLQFVLTWTGLAALAGLLAALFGR